MKKKLGSVVPLVNHKYLNLPSFFSPRKAIVKNLYTQPLKVRNELYETNDFTSLEFYKSPLQNIAEADFEEIRVNDSKV
jgi:hypothetical protein